MTERKPLISVTIADSKFWLSVLNDLKKSWCSRYPHYLCRQSDRFTQAIQACYTKMDIQKCIIHQIRTATRYVSYKDL